MRFGAGRERLVVATLSALLLVAPGARAQTSPRPSAAKPGDAAKAVCNANAAVKEGRYEDAEGLFKQALAAAPDSADAACGLAWTYIKMRRFAEAGATAAGVLRTAPDASDLGASRWSSCGTQTARTLFQWYPVWAVRRSALE